jgi:hypothetical protein
MNQRQNEKLHPEMDAHYFWFAFSEADLEGGVQGMRPPQNSQSIYGIQR